MKICAKCGSSMPEQASICVYCGSTEFNISTPQTQYGQQENYGYQQEQYPQQEDYSYRQEQYPQQEDYSYRQEQYPQQEDYGYRQEQYTQQEDYDYQQEQYTQQEDYGYQQEQYPQQESYGYQQEQYPQQEDYGYQQEQYPQQESYGYQQEQYPQQENYGYQPEQYTQQESYGYQQEQYSQAQTEQYEPQPITEDNYSTQADSEHNADGSLQENSQSEPVSEETPKENPYELSKNFKFEKKDNKKSEAPLKDENLTGFAKIMEMFTNTPDHSFDYEKEDAAANKIISIIALFGITFWVPFVFSPKSRFSRFYANQGLIMLILYIPFSLLYLMFSGLVGIACATPLSIENTQAGLSAIGIIMDIIFFAICFAIPIFILYNCIRNILEGKAKEIPFIGFFRFVN